MSLPTTVQTLISSPARLLAEPDQHPIPRLLGITAFGGAVIGMAAGLQHDGLQGVYSAVKMPGMLIVPPLLVVPALIGLAETLGIPLPARTAATAAIATSARTGLFAAALTPVYWLLGASVDTYNAAVLGLALTMSAGGLFGWAVLAASGRGMATLRSATFTLGAGALFLAAAAQTGWHLRPFVRPPDAEASFFAPPEGDVYSNLKDRLDRMSRWDIPVGVN